MKYKQIFNILIYISMFMVVVLYSNFIKYYGYDIWLTKFASLIIFSLIFHTFYFYYSYKYIFSLSYCFIVLSYLFHFGQIVLVGLFPKYEFEGFNFVYNVIPETFKISSTYSLYVIFLVFLGILLIKKNKNFSIIEVNKQTIKNYKKVAISLIVLFFPIRLYLDLSNILIGIKSGYLSTFADVGSGSGIVSMLGYFSFLGIALLILVQSLKSKKKAFFIYLLVNMYLIMTMIAGGRGHQITLMIFLLYLEHKCIYRIKVKNFLILSIVVIFLVTFLNSLSILRIEGINSWSQLLKSMKTSFESNPFFKLVEEMGGSSYTPYLVFEQIPDILTPFYGETYLKGLITIFPNLNGLFSTLINEANFAKQLKVGSIGGSYIGELYFNFQYIGLFISVFLGMLIEKISIKFESMIVQRKYMLLIIYMPVFTYSLWWVRDCAFSIFRPTIWGYIVVWVIYKFWSQFNILKTKN